MAPKTATLRAEAAARRDARAQAATELHSTRVANIIAVWDQSTPDQRATGATWYAAAGMFARALAGDARAVEAAGVIAALSPQRSWETNRAHARTSYQLGRGIGQTEPQNRKVDLILAGAEPHSVLGDTAPKTHAFYDCIRAELPGQPATRMVCIDRHAADIADGVRRADKARPTISVKVHGDYSDAYVTAAAIIGIPAHHLQAITWVTWRDTHGITDRYGD